MRKITIVIMAVMVVVLFVSGCAQKQTENAPVTQISKPSGGAPQTGDTLGQEVSTEITGIDSTSSELQDANVETLDTDLENIDW